MKIRQRWKSGLWLLAGLMVAIAIIIVSWLPEFVANRFNPITANLSPVESAATQELHQQLRVADLHADSLLWGRDLSQLGRGGHVDVPRLIQGRVALQVFTVVTKVPSPLRLKGNSGESDDIIKLALVQRWPLSTWFSLKARASFQAKRLLKLEKTTKGQFSIIRTQTDLKKYLERQSKNPEQTAGILGLEGAHALEGKLANLEELYDVGYRVIGLAHFFDNELAGSQHGLSEQGLTPLGKEAVRKMDELKLVIDVAHASEATIDDVLAITSRSVMASHTGVQGTCDSSRNLSDEQIRKIANSGGLIGIGFWPRATCGNSPQEIVQAIDYVAKLVGVEHVSLGSDFDGAVGVPFDVADMIQVTHELLETGFTTEDVKKIMGENVIHLFQNTLP